MAESAERRLAQIALLWHGKLGPMGFRRLEAHFGSPQAVLAARAPELALPSLRLDAQQVHAIQQVAAELEEVAAQVADLQRRNVAVVCDFEPGYPEVLSGMRDRPPVLCVAGRLLPADEPAVAIVGTRSPTPEGLARARELGAACAAAGVTVVSGLALGCDTGAHQGALAGGGRTVAVLGSGIELISPRENLELARVIAERGAVLSEQPPEAEASTPHLLARNRLQVGLSVAVIVVQAGPTGGALRTAERALRTGRLLYAVPWSAGEERAAGGAQLLQRGARPLDGGQEVANLVRALFVHHDELRRGVAAGGQSTLFGEEDLEGA